MRALAIVAMIAACSGHHAPAAPDARLDAAVDAAPSLDAPAAAIEIMYRALDGTAAVSMDGGAVPLTFPPQGGFVLLVGFAARKFDLANDMLTASLRDSVTDQLLTVEMRPVQLDLGADGWATPDQPASLINWANLATCPSATATRDLFGQPYVLKIVAQNDTGATLVATQTIVPTCEAGTAGDQCRCQCKLGYKLGDPCP